MSDTIERGVHRLHETPSPLGWTDVEARASGDPLVPAARPVALDDRRPVVRARTWLIGAAAAVLIVAVVAWPRDAGQEVRTDPGVTTSSAPPPTTTDSSPVSTIAAEDLQALGSRRFAVTAVTDDAYLVWGGESGPSTNEIDRTDGFAVDLDSGAVTVIPPAPITADSSGSGAWTGTELVVWTTSFSPGPRSSSGFDAAAWNPATASWRTVASPPLEGAGGGSVAVWAGDQIVAVTAAGAAAAYRPADDRWSLLPPVDVAAPGRAIGHPSLVWTGSEVILWSSSYFGGPFPAPVGGVVVDRGWRWSPGADSWTPLADLPEGNRTAAATAVWTGDELVVWGTATGGTGSERLGVGARWNPLEDTWRPMAPSPQAPGAGFDGTQGSQFVAADAGTGRVVVGLLALNGSVEPGPESLAVYDPSADSWTLTAVVPRSSISDVRDGVVLASDPAAPVAGRL